MTLHFSFAPIGITLLEPLGAFLFAFEQFAENLALTGNLIHVGLASAVTTVFWITENSSSEALMSCVFDFARTDDALRSNCRAM
jgi:hypothetical protein